MPGNSFPGTNIYLPLHFHGFEAKQKNSVCSIIRDVSFQKQLQQSNYYYYYYYIATDFQGWSKKTLKIKTAYIFPFLELGIEKFFDS